MPDRIDVLVIGAGAAGMMCALAAAQRGRSVMLLDHASKLAEKIRISGGGRCNFTNLNARPENYLSANPHFCRSALFCDEGSEAIIAMLKRECDEAGVRWSVPCGVQEIGHSDAFYVTTDRGKLRAESLVVASGGLSIPKIGATPFGYKVAQQFGVPVTRLKPGLVPLSFHPEQWQPYAALAGVSLDAIVSCGKQRFRENLLFTHRGLSGPAILQISSYWEHEEPLSIDLLPEHDIARLFGEHRQGRMQLDNFLAQYWPKRFAELWCAQFVEIRPLNQYSEKQLARLAEQIGNWEITPTGTLGYAKAEVTCGGVDTRALSSRTMESNTVPGLYFIGEVVDVTGQLGGYNFQWAWASGHAAGMAA